MPFLQGLVSNDVEKTSGTHSIFAAFLTAQGKFLHDLFIAKSGDEFLLDCEKARLPDLLKRMSLYKLRSEVTLRDASAEYKIFALWGEGGQNFPLQPGATTTIGSIILYRDPRVAEAGWRALAPADADVSAFFGKNVDFTAYDRHRAELGLPDGSRDLEIDRAILLENGFAELHGIDWDKGCYLGQELTARTKYRGLVRKRLLPCEILSGSGLPPFGTKIDALLADGSKIDAGETRSAISGNPGIVLALLRLEAVDQARQSGGKLLAGDTELKVTFPSWYQAPE